MTPYEQLRTRINELLPDRLRIQKGCELEDQNSYADHELYMVAAQCGVCETHKTRRGCENSDGNCNEHDGMLIVHEGGLYDDYGYIRLTITNEEADNAQRWKILGKPLTIEDVLRALDLNSTDEGTYLSCSSNLMRVQIKNDVAIFDLTKPLSAPENEAACAAVLKLLTV
ncbi:hypothetical protein [Bradyrhizobium sp. AUGA SZCCT0431]|uniref:hypothetical protein n=1 Tax=Bradyrhizobium sp. AUGA SZCCT0431 TaxID=2807674 RepID=UPI001BA893F9|nr:hypothetical protein [Bradyrhizobium sp. AUGA SZCCT0431]MBR1146653.1 hypothetical protein [Bradyrhizobium sp. AUGA SZCCT0431]